MKRWIAPVAVAFGLVVVGPAVIRANTPPNYAMQMLGQPLDAVMHEARQMAYFSSETCFREVKPEGGALTMEHCKALSTAADRYESARFAILRAQHDAKQKK